EEFIDQLVADDANPGLELLHGVGRERWQQQLLGRLVIGWVAGDRRRRRRRLGSYIADDDAPRGKVFGVVGDLLHRFIGGRQVTTQETLGVDDRAFSAQLFPDRKRIFDPVGIGMVEIVNPIGDRGMI